MQWAAFDSYLSSLMRRSLITAILHAATGSRNRGSDGDQKDDRKRAILDPYFGPLEGGSWASDARRNEAGQPPAAKSARRQPELPNWNDRAAAAHASRFAQTRPATMSVDEVQQSTHWPPLHRELRWTLADSRADACDNHHKGGLARALFAMRSGLARTPAGGLKRRLGGRLAQLVRASRLHREGPRFESVTAHQPALARRRRLPRRIPTGEGGLFAASFGLASQPNPPASPAAAAPRRSTPPPTGTRSASRAVICRAGGLSPSGCPNRRPGRPRRW